jgi:hypothetical protein
LAASTTTAAVAAEIRKTTVAQDVVGADEKIGRAVEWPDCGSARRVWYGGTICRPMDAREGGQGSREGRGWFKSQTDRPVGTQR